MLNVFSKSHVGDRQLMMFTLARITGFICIIGFGLDFLALSLRPQIDSLEWRMGYMQQLGERSIILLLGLALVSVSLQASPRRLNIMAWFCFGLGLFISLVSVLYLQDSWRFTDLAIDNLSLQQQQLAQDIRYFSPQSNVLSNPEVISARKEQAIAILEERTSAIKSNTKIRARKTIARTFFSLFLVGIGLLSMGLVAKTKYS